jgi:hypothetical protein
MFDTRIINLSEDVYDALKFVNFETLSPGRSGAVLVNNNENIPIIRTTTKYTQPAQMFPDICYKIMEHIGMSFNNALIEMYDSRYTTMGFHSDQSLDLEDESFICLFSCYQSDDNPRKLIIKNKDTEIESEIILNNNSIVLFSTNTNSKWLHKIIGNSKWIGITFRVSKTLIYFKDSIPYLYPKIYNKVLRISSHAEQQLFYKYKSEENKQIGYKYPEIDYTISVSDTYKIGSL